MSPLLDGLSENEKPRGHLDLLLTRPRGRGYLCAVGGRINLMAAAGRGELLGWRSLLEVRGVGSAHKLVACCDLVVLN